MLKPVFTEKSIKMAKSGKYSFWVGMADTKTLLKSEIAKIFGVHVVTIKTIIQKGEAKRTRSGKKSQVLSRKKAIVTLKDKEKLNIFEENKK